jgi:hypothetical protein
LGVLCSVVSGLLPPPPKPHLGHSAGGAVSRARDCPWNEHTTAPFRTEGQSLLDNVVAGFGRIGASNDASGLPSKGNCGLEQRNHNPEVGGSNPLPATNLFKDLDLLAIIVSHCLAMKTPPKSGGGRCQACGIISDRRCQEKQTIASVHPVGRAAAGRDFFRHPPGLRDCRG